MRHETPILIVTTEVSLAACVRRGLESAEVLVAPPSEASAIVAREVLGGIVVHAGCDPAAARRIVREYQKHQPLGRIAVLAPMDDVTTLTAFAYRDGRVDLFFAPWDLPLLRRFLATETPVAR